MPLRRLAVTALLVVVCLGPPARAGDAPGAFAPYEDLLQVLADLTWHLHDDVYRFAPPKDPTGHDLYKLCLRRVENWEKRYPGRLTDVTAFARGEALERLGEYQRAARSYDKVAAMSSPLAEAARAGAARAAAFAAAAALPESGPDIEGTLVALRAKLDAWGAVVERYQKTPWDAPALVEEERLERVAARFVVEHRHVLEDGDATAERSLRFVIAKHVDSKNLPEHIMRLGDLYADLARDYADQHERPLAFDEEQFVAFADRGLDMYRKVATWDGVQQKPEAQARFAAFEAYKTAVLERYR
jgi:tetratricopeptide (TPR) repeat protein